MNDADWLRHRIRNIVRGCTVLGAVALAAAAALATWGALTA